MEQVPGYPATLKLYRIEASRYWQARCFVDGKILKKSTKTESKGEAIRAAKEFWNDVQRRKADSLPLTQSPTFERVALELLKDDQTRVDRGERRQRLVDDQQQAFNKDIIPFFRRNHVRDVTFARLSEYVDYLRTRGKRPLKSASVRIHLVYIRKILKHAWKLGLVDRLPIFPTVQVQDNPRAWFSKDQYAKLRAVASDECKKGTVVRYHQLTDEIRHLITFMVNTFLRPSDIKGLMHRHVEIENDRGTTKYLRIQPAASKTSNTPVISMEAAVGIYSDVLKFNSARGMGDRDNYVFYPHLENRDFALQTMRRHFDHLLAVGSLKHADDGHPRTLYSLRHTAIMFRLLNGESIDLLTIARNARTSVQMIERFYAKHLTAEMNVEKLHSMKKTKRRSRKGTT